MQRINVQGRGKIGRLFRRKRSRLGGRATPSEMRERASEAMYKLAEARTAFEEALDSLAETTRASVADDTSSPHECDQDGEWVEVVDEAEDASTAFDAPTCSVCGDAQVVASRSDA